MNWESVSSFITVVGIPLLGILMTVIDNRSKRREEAQSKFNELILQHMDKSANVMMANAKIAVNGLSTEAEEKLNKAINEYNTFRSGLKEFKDEQTVAALRTKKGS